MRKQRIAAGPAGMLFVPTFLAVVAALIPAAGSDLTGATYELLDDSPAAAGATHYYIEDVDIYGRVTRHGPVVVERRVRHSTGGRSAPRH